MKETKQLKPPQNPQMVAYLQAYGGKNTQKQTNKKKTPKPQQSNRLLSATKEWMTTVIRAQNKNNCAKGKQMESQTFHN